MSRELDRMRKRSADHITAAREAVSQTYGSLSSNLVQMAEEEKRVAGITRSAAVIIEDLDRDFERATKLTRMDVAFLFLATGLQCVRQYLVTPAKDRKDDQTAAKEAGKKEEHSDRSHRYYNPSLEEIWNNPVPFDANRGSKGALSGFGALGHRGATPGHDPVLGLIFGTANIATSTLTNWRMESFHISTREKHDTLTQRAKTSLVASYTVDKLMKQGYDGKVLIGASVLQEIRHLHSDLYSKNSLPLPFISAISPQFAGELAKRGLDMAAVVDAGHQFVMAMAIDTLIAMVHGMFYDESQGLSRSMYEVRTRRVLLYSNLIASSSNIVVSATMALTGNEAGAMKYLDWGGFANTLRRLIFDTVFIEDVKRDFLKNQLYDMITGEQYDFMKGD